MSSDEEFVTGSCLCKAVTYRATGKPLFKTVCHCYNCRKVSGAPMMGSTVYLASQVTFSGEEHMQIYDDAATDSGKPYKRRFCTRCGGQLGGQSVLAEHVIALNQGSLDEEYVNEWAPSAEQYCQTKAGFVPPLVKDEGAQYAGRFVRNMLGPHVGDGAA